MLTLPIKKKWFDMILSGEKLEEYREITPYWTVRLQNQFGAILLNEEQLVPFELVVPECAKDPIQTIRFRNGYAAVSPSFLARCTLRIGAGEPEWGAEPGWKYFVLGIHDIMREENK